MFGISGCRRFLPSPDRPFPFTTVLSLFGLTSAAATAILVAIGIVIKMGFDDDGWNDDSLLSLPRWVIYHGIALGALIGGTHSAVSAISWKRRSARFKTGGAGVSIPRLHWTVRWGIGWIYLTLLSLLLPFALFHAVEDLRGAWIWRSTRVSRPAN